MEYDVENTGTKILIDFVDEKENDCTAKIFKWHEAPSKLFFELYQINHDKFCNREFKTQKKVFEAISESMQKEGYDVSTLIVENRFKWCRKKYFQLKKNLTGPNKRKMSNLPADLVNALDDMFGKGHNSNPIATISSTSGLRISSNKRKFRELEIIESSDAEAYLHLNDDLPRPSSDEEDSSSQINASVNDIVPPKAVKNRKSAECAELLLDLQHSLSLYLNETFKRNEQRNKFEKRLLDLYEIEVKNAAKFRTDILEILKS